MPVTAETTRSKPRRRWLTFSLRTLLIAATLSSIVLAYFANILIRVRRQQAIRREIESATGAEVYFDHELIGGDEVDETPPGPTLVRWVCGNYAFDHIDAVEFSPLDNIKGRDQDLPVLLKAPELQMLTLNGSEITDRSMTIVGQLHELRELQLYDTHVSDAGIAELTDLQKLEDLSLLGSDVTSGALPDICKLQSLHRLLLHRTSVGDDDLETLVELKQLRELWLSPLVSMEMAKQLKRKMPECRILLLGPNGKSLTEVQH